MKGIALKILAGALIGSLLVFTGYLYAPKTATNDGKVFAELSPGKNLANINASDVSIGRYIKDTDGTESPNRNYNATGFITIKPNTSYSLSFRHMIAWYSPDKKFISGQNTSEITGPAVSPVNARYMRATVASNAWEIFQIEQGTKPTSFESFNYVVEKTDGANVIFTPKAIPPPSIKKPEDIALAKYYYTIPGRQIELYRDNIFFGFPEVSNRSAISISGGVQSGRSTSILPTLLDVGKSIRIAAEISDKDYNPDQYRKSELIVTDESIKSPAVVLNIGDSLTARFAFANEILRSPARPGLVFVGNRLSTKAVASTENEGQGGWTIDAYNQVDYRGILSPFIQPVKDGYRYYGRAEFWVDANSNSPSYNAVNFEKSKSLFSKTTGLLLSPEAGDTMSHRGKYISWADSSWNEVTEDNFKGFEFNFGKYRKVWGIARPDIIHILLGTNDFYFTSTTAFPAKYEAFKNQYDLLITSIKLDSPDAKIIVATPPTSGRQGMFGTLESERAANAYKLLAQSMINDYDNRQAENIYLLDYHAVLDRDYSFQKNQEKPFREYGGGSVVSRTVDITHPTNEGSDQMGKMYFGILQHLR